MDDQVTVLRTGLAELADTLAFCKHINQHSKVVYTEKPQQMIENHVQIENRMCDIVQLEN
jgi:hypothetical protein